jgi:hypothetical protein
MKRPLLLFLVSVFALLAGCASQNRPQYVWKDYSSSLYYIKKTPSEESLKYHKDLLLTIIEESKTRNVRVPPGVYCEYGYILLKEGKKQEAFGYFDLEEQTYPESGVFIRSLKAYASAPPGKGNAAGGDDGVKDGKAEGPAAAGKE